MAYSSDFFPADARLLANIKPSSAPIIWASTKSNTESSAIPVNELVNTLPIVIAGLAKEVLEVNKIAPNIQIGT